MRPGSWAPGIPGIRYHIASGNADFVIDRLDKGLIDLAWFTPTLTP